MSWCPVRSVCIISPCLTLWPGIDIGVSAGMWSLIKDQTDPGPGPDLWQIAQSLLVCQAQKLSTRPRPRLITISSWESDWSALREKLNTDVFIYKMLPLEYKLEPELRTALSANNLIWKRLYFCLLLKQCSLFIVTLSRAQIEYHALLKR